MNGTVNSPDAPGDDPWTVTGIRAIDEPGEGLVALEVTVGGNRASLRKDRPGEHPWFGQFRHRVRFVWGQRAPAAQWKVSPTQPSASVMLRRSAGPASRLRKGI